MSLLYFYKYPAFEVFLIFIGIFLFIDGLIAWILNCLSKHRWALILHAIIAITVYISLVWAFFIKRWEPVLNTFSSFFFLTNHLTLLYLSKIVFLTFAWIFLIFRKKFIVKIASTLATAVFLLLFYGLYFGRFHFIVKETEILSEKNLGTPLRIACITDLHLGQYYGHEKQFERLIQKINNQHPDLILLGGDMICCFAEEMKPFIPYLRQLKARYGVYAVHGNHDYGDYFWWKNISEKKWNHQILEYYYSLAHIRLLNNEHIRLKAYPVVVAGVENCGHPPYGCYANWNKALKGISSDDYTILLVHDPWNWAKVVEQYPQIKLTLSGHTHAYQIGIDNGHTRWSPFYPKNPWCGLYAKKDQFLYISHGVGSAMFSGRAGMWPEISLITIR